MPGCECSQRTDFEPSDYLKYSVSDEEIWVGLESWLREALIVPFEYEGKIREDGKFVAFGQEMTTMGEHALEERVGRPGYERMRAELTGVYEMERLFAQAVLGDLLVLVSPPGTEEEGFGADGQRRLSFTYLGMVKELGDGLRRKLRVVSIPMLERSIGEHVGVFGELGWGEELTDRKLVAEPKLVKGGLELDSVTHALVGKSWEEVEKEVAGALSLREDERAEGRRRSLFGTITWQIRRLVEEEDEERLENIGRAVRLVLAREAAGHFVRWTSEQLLEEYWRTEESLWLTHESSERYVEGGQTWPGDEDKLVLALAHLREVQGAIMEDASAWQILAGSSCGGGWASLMEVMIGGRMVDGQQHQLERNMLLGGSGVSEDVWQCVTCPFCKRVVDAIVTSTKIRCPECEREVDKG